MMETINKGKNSRPVSESGRIDTENIFDAYFMIKKSDRISNNDKKDSFAKLLIPLRFFIPLLFLSTIWTCTLDLE